MSRVNKDFLSPVDEATIGKRLREIRESRGMTQVDLAERLNIRQEIVSGYERGVVRIHGALIAAFAQTLDVSADEILGIQKGKRSSGRPKDRRTIQLVNDIDSLPRRERDALLKTISNFVRGARSAA